MVKFSKFSRFKRKKKSGHTESDIFTTWQMVEHEPLEKVAQVVLRELIIYVIFVFFVAYMCLSMTTPSMFYHHEFFRKLFVASQFESVEGPDISLMDVHAVANIWKYLEHIQLNGFYWDAWSRSTDDNSDPSINQTVTVYDNKMLGVPRLRQLRVRSDSCYVASHFVDTIRKCYAKFSSGTENDQSYGPNQMFNYSETETSSNSYNGHISRYHGRGFIVNWVKNSEASSSTSNSTGVETLKNNVWIDRATRVVFLEFTVYNPNVNLFCIAKIVFECPPTGGVFPSYLFRSVKLIPYVTISDYILMACQIIVTVFLIFYTILTLKEMNYLGTLFYSRYWNWITLLMLVFGYIGFLCELSAFLVFQAIKSRVHLTDTYVNLENPAYIITLRETFFGLFVFLVFIRLFKYLAISHTMGQLNSTFNKCRSDIQSFSVLFMLIFLAFSITGYLFFGRTVMEFSGIGIAMFTLLRAVLGDFDYDKINEANSFLAPIFFLSFIFLVFFILLNMFLAIINDAYADVKSEMSSAPKYVHLAHYVENAFKNLIAPYRSPSTKDDTKELTPYEKTISEIRIALQRCGFKESEIDMFFARYNIDPTATYGSFDINKIMAELEPKPYDMKGDKKGVAKTVTEAEFLIQQQKLLEIEKGIANLTSKVDCLLRKLDALDSAKKHKK